MPDHFYLSEFDPYYQYRITKNAVENGLLSWAWYDHMSWYPWGRDVARTSFPGLAITTASLYMILRALGVPIDLVQFSLIFPAIMGTITCLVIYSLGKDVGGESVGLFSAFFLALNSSYISRTSLGFFDDETIGILGILLFILFFLRAIEEGRPLKSGIIYSIAAGLSLGYLFASWGAARYPVDMTVLFVFTLLFIRRYSSRLFLSYGICFTMALLIAISIPKLGMDFLRDASILPVYGIFFLMCIFEIHRRMKTPKMKILGIAVFLAVFASAFSSLLVLGYVQMPAGKYISVLNPLERAASPLVESVAEHKSSTWSTFYYDLGVLAFFIPLGLFFAVQMATNRSIFLSIFVLTSIYFASSMIRLTLIMAPAVCLAGALGVVNLMKPFVMLLKESPATSRRKIFSRRRLGKEFSVGFLIVIFLLFTFTYVVGTDFSRTQSSLYPRVFDQAYSPTTIAVASMGFRPPDTVKDWLNTLIWMREELPPSPPDGPTVVASWWDYGYWITTIGNRTSLADNGTLNTTQIAQLATMFMSPEDEAIEILKNWPGEKVTHVLVFTTVAIQTSQQVYYGIDYPWGEAGKFIWMIKIAGLNESLFGGYTQQGGWQWSDYGKNTTLYKMMTYGKFYLIDPGITLVDSQGYQIEPVFLNSFKLVYPKTVQPVSGVYALVLVYEVEY